MDYCHPCQRHLNGALACAGCGTPVEALSPYVAPAFSGHEPDAVHETPAPPRPGGRRRRGHGADRPARAGHGSRGADRRGGGEGPAAREGRGRRAHRRRGRTALFAVLGVVLAAGVLSLAQLAIEPNGDDRASDYVRESTEVTSEPAPDPSASDAPERPGPVDDPSVLPVTDAHRADATGAGAGTATGDARPEGSGAEPGPASAAPPGATDDPSPDPDPDPDLGADEETPADPSDTARPGGGPTRPAPATSPSAGPSPTPAPTRSETCWFLFFCS
ncbi:hypothetical protein ACF1BU_18830 [Streptomyces sp. NPDC014724]|uniref:SCO2400 family protein n=1 Tax=unclassified Streptomyces TaxID=2593676 RepID=UPI0036FEA47A